MGRAQRTDDLHSAAGDNNETRAVALATARLIERALREPFPDAAAHLHELVSDLEMGEYGAMQMVDEIVRAVESSR